MNRGNLDKYRLVDKDKSRRREGWKSVKQSIHVIEEEKQEIREADSADFEGGSDEEEPLTKS